jgi:imidazoleglycerol phosphate synthase glutamine amidotransferase subunit HisH
MNIVTFTGNLYSVNKSNNTVKTNLTLNQNTQPVLPVSDLITPDSGLLKVSFTGLFQKEKFLLNIRKKEEWVKV